MDRHLNVAATILIVCFVLPGSVAQLGWRPTWLLAGCVLVAIATGVAFAVSYLLTRTRTTDRNHPRKRV